MDYGASELGSAAVDTGASSSLADFAGSTAADTGAFSGASSLSGSALPVGLSATPEGTSAALSAFPEATTVTGSDLGLAGGTGGTLAGGTGEFAAGATASDLAAQTGQAVTPGLIDQITSLYNSASPYINTAGKILSVGNMLKNAVSGAGTPATGAANTPSPAAATTSTPPSQNQMTRDDYIKQQEAYWQNLLAAQGNSLPGNQLPPNIADAIRRQASMYPA